MILFGRYCQHDACSWISCDFAAPPASAIEYGCRKQAECPYCGLTSPDWPRIAHERVAWCVEWYGTADSGALRARGSIPPNVVETAELVEAHPRDNR